MAKRTTAYVCSDCGSEYSQWQGQCKDCGAWNTLARINVAPASTGKNASLAALGSGFEGVRSLAEVDLQPARRIESNIGEFDRVLGGGFVPGSAVLLGGNPGAGKSTLVLQVTAEVSAAHSTLYVTGEESLQQIAMRARRLEMPLERLDVMAHTSVDLICREASQRRPSLLVIDSIQAVRCDEIESAAGGVTQVKESAARLIRFAKESATVLMMIGHVTKEGSLAGPKVLEHMIDCFMMLEGDADGRFRTLRGNKNRFGAVNELGVFAMTERGLREVTNPSAIFLSRSPEDVPGSLVMVVWEGTRPLLVEAQALVDQAASANPRRVAVGVEQNRLAMLLAVLHRHGGVQVTDQDVFVNVVGGIEVDETGSDLACLLAILSSFRGQPLSRELVAFGEVGLSGEVRPVPNGVERLQAAAKHGFRRAIVPKANAPRKPIPDMDVVGVSHLREAIDAISDR